MIRVLILASNLVVRMLANEPDHYEVKLYNIYSVGIRFPPGSVVGSIVNQDAKHLISRLATDLNIVAPVVILFETWEVRPIPAVVAKLLLGPTSWLKS